MRRALDDGPRHLAVMIELAMTSADDVIGTSKLHQGC
jgi:hypothetical protein